MAGNNTGREPQRTCCICRKKLAKGDLLRFVWQQDGVVLDQRQILPGRGAYCCGEKCAQLLLVSRKKWKRLFRLE